MAGSDEDRKVHRLLAGCWVHPPERGIGKGTSIETKRVSPSDRRRKILSNAFFLSNTLKILCIAFVKYIDFPHEFFTARIPPPV